MSRLQMSTKKRSHGTRRRIVRGWCLGPADCKYILKNIARRPYGAARSHDAGPSDVRGRPGALVHDALKVGIDPGAQRTMMNEALEVIIPLLRGETVNRKTDWFNLTEAQLQLRCYTRPTMELAVAAARSPAGSLAAGKYGIGMLSIGGTSPMAMEAHTRNWGLYEETARANGHVPDRNNWRVVGMFHIAETREQARQNVR